MGATKEQSEQNRRHILEVALRMFGEKGFSACRLEDIAQAAGVTRGAIYWHFKNKIDLFIQLFTEKVRDFYEQFLPLTELDLPPLERIRNLLHYIVKRLNEDPDMRAIALLQYNIEWTQEVHQKLVEAFNSLKIDEIKPLVKLVEEAKEKRDIKPNRSTLAVVAMIRLFIHGIAHTILDELEKISVAQVEEAVDEFVDMLGR
ncbi:MAG: multidrug efflux transporter transcriptional repressor AcrR [Calditrichia bacterium]